MAGSPQKRARKLAAELAEELRASEAADGVRLDRNGKPLKGAAGQPMSPEMKAKLAEARRQSLEEKRLKRDAERVSLEEARAKALDRMMPKVYQVWEMALDGAIDRGSVDSHSLKAAMSVFEQQFGKATQKVEEKREAVTKIVYEAAPFEFDPN